MKLLVTGEMLALAETPMQARPLQRGPRTRVSRSGCCAVSSNARSPCSPAAGLPPAHHRKPQPDRRHRPRNARPQPPPWPGRRCGNSSHHSRPATARAMRSSVSLRATPTRGRAGATVQRQSHQQQLYEPVDLDAGLRVENRRRTHPDGRCASVTDPWRVPSSHRLAGEATGCTRRRRRAPVAAGALMPGIAQPPAPGMTARRAGETARPAQPLQVVQAARLGAEPRLEHARRPRVVNSGPGLIHARAPTPVKSS